MIKLVVSILVYPCISGAAVNPVANSTEIYACPNTVRIEQREMDRRIVYGRYADNFFRLRRIMAQEGPRVVLR